MKLPNNKADDMIYHHLPSWLMLACGAYPIWDEFKSDTLISDENAIRFESSASVSRGWFDFMKDWQPLHLLSSRCCFVSLLLRRLCQFTFMIHESFIIDRLYYSLPVSLV